MSTILNNFNYKLIKSRGCNVSSSCRFQRKYSHTEMQSLFENNRSIIIKEDLRKSIHLTFYAAPFSGVPKLLKYDKLLNWMKGNCVEYINETLLLGCFGDLVETLFSISLWCKYSMIKISMENKNSNIAIYHNEFKRIFEAKINWPQARKI